MQSGTSGTSPLTAGAAFRALREGAGLDIRRLAAMADISHGTISRWERGEREVSLSTREHLRVCLNAWIDERNRAGASS